MTEEDAENFWNSFEKLQERVELNSAKKLGVSIEFYRQLKDLCSSMYSYHENLEAGILPEWSEKMYRDKASYCIGEICDAVEKKEVKPSIIKEAPLKLVTDGLRSSKLTVEEWLIMNTDFFEKEDQLRLFVTLDINPEKVDPKTIPFFLAHGIEEKETPAEYLVEDFFEDEEDRDPEKWVTNLADTFSKELVKFSSKTEENQKQSKDSFAYFTGEIYETMSKIREEHEDNQNYVCELQNNIKNKKHNIKISDTLSTKTTEEIFIEYSNLLTYLDKELLFSSFKITP